jgi:hypothetical protein
MIKIKSFIPKNIGDNTIFVTTGCTFPESVPVYFHGIEIGTAAIKKSTDINNTDSSGLDAIMTINEDKKHLLPPDLFKSERPMNFGLGYSVGANNKLKLHEVSMIAPDK